GVERHGSGVERHWGAARGAGARMDLSDRLAADARVADRRQPGARVAAGKQRAALRRHPAAARQGGAESVRNTAQRHRVASLDVIDPKHEASIEFCFPRDYLDQAVSLANELLAGWAPILRTVELRSGSTGWFEVILDGDLVFSKAQLKG